MSILTKFKFFNVISDFFKRKLNKNSEETWIAIQGYNGKYLVSSYGRVYNSEREVMMNTYKKKDGYERVSLYDKENKIKEYRIHRLVAQHFLKNNDDKKNVIHLDKNKDNNKVNNLKWK